MLKAIVIGCRGSVQHLLFWISIWAPVLAALAPAADAAADKGTVYAPYVVAVLKKQILSCSGFLLSKKYVGVGCHCIASLEEPGRPRLNGLKLIDYDFVAGQVNPKRLITAQYKRKPRALLTHPYCEYEPPILYDVGIAVMEEPFPIIQDVIEVYDFLSTNPDEFTKTLLKMFSWKRPEDAPNCTFAGWKFSGNPDQNQLMTMEMISLSSTECKELWRNEDPSNIGPNFNFSYPEQFCLVTRDVAQDEAYLPNDGPFVCNRLHVGLVSYGPDRRTKTRVVPVVTQSLAVMVDWVQFDSYFENIGCFGREADCRKDDKIGDKTDKSTATKYTTGPCGVIIIVCSLSLLAN